MFLVFVFVFVFGVCVSVLVFVFLCFCFFLLKFWLAVQHNSVRCPEAGELTCENLFFIMSLCVCVYLYICVCLLVCSCVCAAVWGVGGRAEAGECRCVRILKNTRELLFSRSLSTPAVPALSLSFSLSH